jgi:hypothetical protein
MILLATGMILFAASHLIWFFGVRRYVVKNKGFDTSGANVGLAAWNDFTLAREIRKETKKNCIYIEAYAVSQIVGILLVFLGIFRLT